MLIDVRFRGKGYFKKIAEIILEHGYVTRNLQKATVMTAASNPITNAYFQNLGFKEFFREAKPAWHEKNATGIHYKMRKEQWLQHRRY